MKRKKATDGCPLVVRIGVHRTSIRKPTGRISVLFVERVIVPPVLFCADVRGQHGELSNYKKTKALSSRTKHICTRYQFLRELVAANKFIVCHVKTADQLADIFIKLVDYPKHKVMLDKMVNLAC